MLEVKFTTFPTLQTPRLLLREILPSDAEAIFKMRSDERVMRYIGKSPMKDIGEAKELIETYRKAYEQNEAVNWAICLREQPEWQIGTLGFWRMDKVNHRCEIGYTLQYDYWRQGIMSEAITAPWNTVSKSWIFTALKPIPILRTKVLEAFWKNLGLFRRPIFVKTSTSKGSFWIHGFIQKSIHTIPSSPK